MMKRKNSEVIMEGATQAAVTHDYEMSELLELIATATKAVEDVPVISSGEQMRWTPTVMRAREISLRLTNREAVK